MQPYWIPYATIRDGQPFVSFYVGDSEDTSIQDTDKSKVEDPRQVDKFDYLDAYVGERGETDDDEILRRRIEAQNRRNEMEDVVNVFFDDTHESTEDTSVSSPADDKEVSLSKDETDIEQQIQDIHTFFEQPLPAAKFGDNIQTIKLHPVFGNMSNDDKHELEITATKEVVKNMELSEDHPEYNKVLCERIEKWIVEWVEKKEAEVKSIVSKQRNARLSE